MVKLIETSSISAEVSPILREWDELVRKNFNKYQKLIDARTFELQRIQRYILVHLSLPREEATLQTTIRIW